MRFHCFLIYCNNYLIMNVSDIEERETEVRDRPTDEKQNGERESKGYEKSV